MLANEFVNLLLIHNHSLSQLKRPKAREKAIRNASDTAFRRACQALTNGCQVVIHPKKSAAGSNEVSAHRPDFDALSILQADCSGIR
jgi:hypothetical protein